MNANASTTPSGEGTGTKGNLRTKTLIRFGIFALVLAALWYFVSGHPERVMPWLFIGTWAIVGGLVPALIVPLDEALGEERTQIKEGVQGWDKPIVILGSLWVPLGIVVFAALDVRFGWSSPVPFWVQIVGLVLSALGYLLSVWASASNKFYGRFVRIQADRGHTVVTGGPYRYVRHPGYAGMAAFLIASPLALNSLWTLVPNGVFIVLMIVRTALEDRFLQENLDGYQEYAQRTRYRLLPGIW